MTIILPTCSRAALLQALASCLPQILDEREVTVVDDGSTDGTADVVEARLEEELLGVWTGGAYVRA